MNPYSNDLRKRVIHDAETKKLSINEIMEKYSVSYTFVYNLNVRYKETGVITPKAHAGGTTPKFDGEELKKIKTYVEEHPDATLEEILKYTQKKASIMAISRALDRLGFRRKKNRYGHRNRNVTT